jgi:UDPglucose 6-dehydrogenase
MFLEAGMTVRAHDPEALHTAASELGRGVQMVEDGYDAVDGADGLVIFTDWQKFRTPDFDLMASKMRQKVIFDGRNLYDPRAMAKRGFQYICIGRPTLPTM